MRVNQVGVGNVVVKRLIAIGNAFWYENCRARIDFVRENRAEAVTFAQIAPCQPFSLGGLARAALDPRDMFPAMTSVVATLRPRAFVCENVRGLTRSSFSDYYNYILMKLQHPLVE